MIEFPLDLPSVRVLKTELTDKEELPRAVVASDRFHVVKAYRDCADKLRKTQTRELKAALPKEEYEVLKGTMWPFRSSGPQKLSAEQHQSLELLLECSPELKAAYELREDLTQIFETDHTKTSATAAIEDWQTRVRPSGLTCFDSFLTTLSHWMDEITNYFLDRQTSGFVEELNNKIKVIKRRCYGITNVTYLFQRIFLDLEGYRLFAT
jgi:transposase